MALGSTQPLTEMSTRNYPGGKGRRARGADLTPCVSRLSRKCGSLDLSQPYGPSWPVTGIALHFLPSCCGKRIDYLVSRVHGLDVIRKRIA
jgi:hypothetical protein